MRQTPLFLIAALGVFMGFSDQTAGAGWVRKARDRAKQTVNHGIKKLPELPRKLDDIPHTITKTVNKAGEGAANLGNSVVTKADKPIANAVTLARKAIGDVQANANKGVKDIAWNYEKAGNDLVGATQAVGRFVGRQLEGYKDVVTDAESRVRDGKVVDALWHLSTDPITNSKDNAAKAAQENDLVNAAMSTAASTYGGPAGAAAYAAWLAYERTHDANLALRVGVIAGLQASAAQMPSGATSEAAKKALVTGAIGGLAVAAAGGDDAAVRDAFIRQGGMVIVQAGQNYASDQIAKVGGEVDSYCSSAVGARCTPALEAIKVDGNGKVIFDARGLPLVDEAKVDASRTELGSWKEQPSAGLDRQVPGTNGILLGEQWAVSWDKEVLTSKAANLPGISLTYVGRGSPYEHKVHELTAE